MNRVKMRSVRGISTFLAVLILIAVTLVAGVTVYSVFFRTAGSLGSGVKVNVEVQLVKGTDTTLFSSTVKNIGTEAITSCTVTLVSGSKTWALTIGAISVGGTASASDYAVPTGMTIEAGKSYPVVVEATGASGKYTTSTTVTCIG